MCVVDSNHKCIELMLMLNYLRNALIFIAFYERNLGCIVYHTLRLLA